MRTDGERYDLHRNLRQFARLYQPIQLRTHDLGTADKPVQRRLVEHFPELRHWLPLQQILSSEPCFDSLFYHIWGWLPLETHQRRASVICGLQEGGNNG